MGITKTNVKEKISSKKDISKETTPIASTSFTGLSSTSISVDTRTHGKKSIKTLKVESIEKHISFFI